ncbi:hypothetical protein Mgra_00006597 [Meloidogyne graminicola]|uniref:Uncharacterized protein n=1 Tax=Meloidogyne graminicola TaxID=189291 RepID=A0A8S9ZKZ9_9BILA|nr:hypothetical protein Mgra_00006597 [Meloidogyne graminicola]
MVSEIFSIVVLCFAAIGLVFNFLLIYLVIRFTLKEMEIYSKILLQTSIVDIICICLLNKLLIKFILKN